MIEKLEQPQRAFVSNARSDAIASVSVRKHLRRAIVAASAIIFLFYIFVHRQSIDYGIEENVLRYLSLSNAEQIRLHDSRLAALQAGLRQCARIKEAPVTVFEGTRTNPRAVASSQPILIRNATMIDGDGNIVEACSILLTDGIFSKIGHELDAPKHAKIIDVRGRYVTPGLVDMHSHAGVSSLPDLFGTDDTNEVSGDITPWVRTIDGINPSDEMFERIASGGVTTSLILPGSANNIGGEAYVLKLRKVQTLSVEEMLLQYNITTKPERWVKMACGENPKRVYGQASKWPGGPNTRLGEAWRFRQTFERAQALLTAQDNWCLKAQAAASTGKLSILEGQDFPSELELDVIIGVLRGDVRVNVHCYETMDLETMLRHATEFNFQVTAFHHALDAWRVPEMISKGSEPRDGRTKRNITVATFGMLWGYKKEAYQANPWAGKILSKNNIPVAYKSDHPVTNAQHLLYEAQIGHHFGLEEDLAIASLTSVPARALGLDHRVGYVRVGYDADLVIWDSHPLGLGATPIQVFIDGLEIFGGKTAEKKLRGPIHASKAPPQRPFDEAESLSLGGVGKKILTQDFIATGISKAYLRDGDGLNEFSTTDETLTMVVRNGSIICLSASCNEEMETAVKQGADIHNLKNGYILPGLTALSPSHGLMDIESESSTRDGFVDNMGDPSDSKKIVYAKDGLTFDGRHLERAFGSGILNLITAPLSRGFVQGVSVAFKSGGSSVMEADAVIQEEVALHFSIGHGTRGSSTPSISSQIAALRNLLTDNQNVSDTVYGRAANGKIPLAISTQNKDVIAHLLKMKMELADIAPINLVIIGGIEAYLIADDIAKANVPIILTPWRCQPETWEFRHCLPGPPISEKTSFQILVEHGVPVALGASDDGLLTALYWEAGWAAKGTELLERDVVGLISTKVEDILGIKWNQKEQGGHVMFEGNPLNFGANLVAVF